MFPSQFSAPIHTANDATRLNQASLPTRLRLYCYAVRQAARHTVRSQAVCKERVLNVTNSRVSRGLQQTLYSEQRCTIQRRKVYHIFPPKALFPEQISRSE